MPDVTDPVAGPGGNRWVWPSGQTRFVGQTGICAANRGSGAEGQTLPPQRDGNRLRDAVVRRARRSPTRVNPRTKRGAFCVGDQGKVRKPTCPSSQ